MSRRCRPLLWVALAVGLALVGAGCTPDARPLLDRPNVVVILTDDQGYGDLSCYGSPTLATPRIDRMADEGMRFTDFSMAASVCTPSRAALMTGRYAQRVGLPAVLFPSSLPDLTAMESGGISATEVTIAELLGARGYATACIGKWHLGDRPEFLPTRHGFEQFFGLPYSNDMRPANPARPYPPLPLMRGERVVETDPDQSLLMRRYTQEAVRFILDHRDRPFFLYLAHAMPHRPLHVSDEYLARFSDQELAGLKVESRSRDFLYPAVISEIDWSVGEILDALEESRLDDRTLVVFLSDNGPSVGSLGSAGPLRGRKGSMFEGGFRVPCLMRWPGRIPAGSVYTAPCSGMDLLPTLAHLAGVAPPSDRIIDGRDISQILTGEAVTRSAADAFFYFGGNRMWGVRQGNWKLLWERDRAAGDAPGEDQRRTGAILRRALYDLEADVGETTDLAERHPDVAARLLDAAERFERELWQDDLDRATLVEPTAR